MLKPRYYCSSSSTALLPKACIHRSGGHGGTWFPAAPSSSLRSSASYSASIPTKIASRNAGRLGYYYNKPGNIKAISLSGIITGTGKSTKVKAVVTVNRTIGGFLSNLLSIDQGLDNLTELLGRSLHLEFVSAELDPKTGSEKPTIKGYVHKTGDVGDEVKYEADFEVPADFGVVGAVLVENDHREEMFIKDIVLDGFPSGPVAITCNSWAHSKFDDKRKRIFFANKQSTLPANTPDGLKRLREEDLKWLRGDGQGERKKGERIYDYDVYNDLGDPDSKPELARPVLGGKDHPYPRRCRTGRARSSSDPASETTSSSVYVPRDEEFAEVKQATFSAKTFYSVLHALVPSLETAIVDPKLGFPYFTAIDFLFDEGITWPPQQKQGFLKTLLPRLVKAVSDSAQDVLRFEPPQTMDRNKFFWFSDEEFARQTLAGLHPCALQLVTEWPLKSKLDPEIYGPPESAITTKMIEREIRGCMTVDEAIKQKKLFILDYHDLLLPFVSLVRQLEGTTLYGSRALFFLTPEGTLRPLAIELTRPPMDGKPQWKEAYAPAWHSTGLWLWRLAKAHVLAHDSGYHQLVSHWLRTHCATEPYIIAAHRQLSAMHPIFRFLHPHFRYTMEINALARQALINAGGIIESSFSPGKYSLELSSVIYDKQWRFDNEALPKDLISRGMAVEDPSAPHGLKLTIEDYPYANDGLVLWDTIKEWVSEYVNHYYTDPSRIVSDEELQAWWAEVRNKGHADKKDEQWWPELKAPQDLVEILTTIIWVASGHHAAVNFGQYTYAAYFPNRPTIARSKMPTEDPNEEGWKYFLQKPEVTLLTIFPTQIQATKVMAVLDVLSSHSPDEEYLGEEMEPAWAEDPVIKGAFERFSGKLKELEGIIDERNADEKLKNRNGAGIVPYELLKPSSDSGVTAKGVPYSISI